MIEAVIAVALLATASLAVVQLARSSVDLQLRGDREIAAILTAQNVLMRLDGMDSAQLQQDQMAVIEQSASKASGCEVAISLIPFDGQGAAGTHIEVEVTAGNQVRVQLHDWRLASSSQSTENAQGESTSSPAQELSRD